MLQPITKFKKLFTSRPLITESGSELYNVNIAYQDYGELNEAKDNVILICHALTGNAHAAGIITEEELANSAGYPFLYKYNKMFLGKQGWWDPLIGPGKPFDTNKYFVICVNIPGSCYGTTGPADVNPKTGKKFGMSFPAATVRDAVNIQHELLTNFGVKKIKAVAGGSLGGMQALEWGATYGGMVENLIPIASSAAHSPWAVGINKMARRAIYNDPAWNNGEYGEQPFMGLSHAREIAMISYRTYDSFLYRFGREMSVNSTPFIPEGKFQVESYLEYQGQKLVKRFDANSYIYLSLMLDNHDLARGRTSMTDVFSEYKGNTLAVGINSDVIYPPSEQKEIASIIPNAEYAEINSIYGHDAFLIEFEQLENILGNFLNKHK